MNIARADYIVVGNNPTSEYAYTVLGGNRNAKVPSSFSRKLRLNSSGFDVIVVQRALEVLGYYDHLEGNKYGTFDENTLEAANSFHIFYQEKTMKWFLTTFRSMCFSCG